MSEQVKHGKKPGTTGYRKGCRCAECIQANKDYLRDWRERKRREQLPEPPAPEPAVEAPGASVTVTVTGLDDDGDTGLPGPVEVALTHDLDDPAATPLVLRAIGRTVARAIDGAMRQQRHDLVSPLVKLLLDGVPGLLPQKEAPAPAGEDEERAQLLRLIQGDDEGEAASGA